MLESKNDYADGMSFAIKKPSVPFSLTADEFYGFLFDRSSVLLNDQQRHSLRYGSVGCAGVGGVGCICIEMLVRLGIGTLGVADPERFEPTNLNRQLFSTLLKTQYGQAQNKAISAAERILEINPFCDVLVFPRGINVSNVREFVRRFSVIVNEVDRESVKCLLHRIAREERVPVVSASRATESGHRWSVMTKVWNYRDNPSLPTFEEMNHPELAAIRTDLLTDEVLQEYDVAVHKKMHDLWNDIFQNQDDLTKFGIPDRENAIKAMSDSPEHYHKQTILSPIANIAGAIASIDVFKLLTGYETMPLFFNLWDGSPVWHDGYTKENSKNGN